MTKTDAKRILRAYAKYDQLARKKHNGNPAKLLLSDAAMVARNVLGPKVVPALNACGITRDGAIAELIAEALATGPRLGRPAQAWRKPDKAKAKRQAELVTLALQNWNG